MIKFVTMAAYFIGLYFVVFWMLVYLQRGIKEPRKRLDSFPLVTVVIPAYNEEKNIDETIRSVCNLDYPKEMLEIIVVNDGSKDQTAARAQDAINSLEGYNIRLINQKNQGKGAAMNTALKHAHGEFFVSMDADSEVEKNALKAMLPEFTAPNIAAVLPLIKVKHPSNWIRKMQSCEYLLNFFYKKLMGYLDCIHVAPGPFAVYRREVILKLGGFDTHNLTEDFEMAVRLQKNHYSLAQVLSTTVWTKAPGTFRQFYRQRNRWFKGAWINMFRYRSMLFNPEYGDLGIMQLPLVFVSGFISISLFLITIVWHTLRPMMQKLHEYAYINFDVAPLFVKGIKEFSFLNYNYPQLFFGLSILALVTVSVLLSIYYTGESVRHHKQSILFFMIAYPWVMGIIWIGVIFDLIRGKVQAW